MGKRGPKKKTVKKKMSDKNVRLDKVEKLYKAGWTDEQVADFFGITRMTLDRWCKQSKTLLHLKEDWKRGADEKVEKSLYQRACGYSHDEEVIKVVAVGANNGSEIERVDTVKHYAPDPTSMIFWLKNRQPKKWKDIRGVQVGGDPQGDPIKIDAIKDMTNEELSKAIGEYLNGQ